MTCSVVVDTSCTLPKTQWPISLLLTRVVPYTKHNDLFRCSWHELYFTQNTMTCFVVVDTSCTLHKTQWPVPLLLTRAVPYPKHNDLFRYCWHELYYTKHNDLFRCCWHIIIIIIINPLTAKVVGAPQMILEQVFSIFPCSPLPSGTCRTPDLSIFWCCLLTSSFVRLVFFPLSLCIARWFWQDLMNGRHDHTTAVCVSLRSSGDLHVVQLPAGSWHRLPLNRLLLLLLPAMTVFPVILSSLLNPMSGATCRSGQEHSSNIIITAVIIIVVSPAMTFLKGPKYAYAKRLALHADQDRCTASLSSASPSSSLPKSWSAFHLLCLSQMSSTACRPGQEHSSNIIIIAIIFIAIITIIITSPALLQLNVQHCKQTEIGVRCSYHYCRHHCHNYHHYHQWPMFA